MMFIALVQIFSPITLARKPYFIYIYIYIYICNTANEHGSVIAMASILLEGSTLCCISRSSIYMAQIYILK